MTFCHPKKIGSQTLLRFYAITPQGKAERIKILMGCYSPTVGSQQTMLAHQRYKDSDCLLMLALSNGNWNGNKNWMFEIGSGEFAPPPKNVRNHMEGL